MNVLFVDQFSDLGGAQHCLLDLIPAVLGRGWGAHVLIPGLGRLSERLASLGIQSSHIPCGPYHSGGKNVGDFVRFGRNLATQIRIIRSHTADLVYVNGPRLLPPAAFCGVPVLFHAHNYLGVSYAKRAAGWSIRASGASVIACSRFVAEPFVSYTPAGKLHVIPNGTPDMGFRQREFTRGNMCVGIIGKLCREKGQSDFLRAASLIRQTFRDTRFVVCGDGNEEALRKLASGLNVTFLGWQNDIASVLAGLDLLVIASQQEGLPRVMLEAFSAGVPVIAYPAGGIREAIEDGVTGFLVPQSTPEALAARICELNEELPAVAAAARQLWEQRYTLIQYRTRILEVMQEAALGRRAESAVTPLRQHTG